MDKFPIGRLFRPALIAAGATVCLALVPTLVAGGAVGLSWALASDMPGWAILSVPAGMSFGVKAFVAGLPTGLVVAALWVGMAVLLERFMLKPNVRLRLAVLQGLVIGLPGIAVSLAALDANGFLKGQLYNDGHPHLKLAAQWLAVTAPAVAGMIAAGLRRKPRGLAAAPPPP